MKSLGNNRIFCGRLALLTMGCLHLVGCTAHSVGTCPMPADDDDVLRAAMGLAGEGKHGEAIKRFDEFIAAHPDHAEARYWRGRSAFCAARIDLAVSDFDRYVELKPNVAPRQWERGIALYYAQEFKSGAEQFELYQTYHDNDVENSTWRYLCVARDEGVHQARDTILPIRNDTRVPMMKIYAMYKGEVAPEEVLAEARAGSPSEDQLNHQLFYAHLYIGLYFEAHERMKEGLEHIRKAREHRIDHYMWNVADVHVRLAEQDERD